MNPQNPPPDLSALPCHDVKPHGAADFYHGTNATFAFIKKNLGMEELIRYWRELGTDYMKPVWERWKKTGLEGIETYWRAFFSVEPGSNVCVSRSEDEVAVEVAECPAIKHFRTAGRVVCPEYCQHCYYMHEAAAEKAGFTTRVTGGNGSCRQRFFAATANQEPQNIEEIELC